MFCDRSTVKQIFSKGRVRGCQAKSCVENQTKKSILEKPKPKKKKKKKSVIESIN